MAEIKYKHLIEYDPEANKIVIHRMLESGQKHLYTEISISEISREQRTLQTVGRILGESLVLDMNQVRDTLT